MYLMEKPGAGVRYCRLTVCREQADLCLRHAKAQQQENAQFRLGGIGQQLVKTMQQFGIMLRQCLLYQFVVLLRSDIAILYFA